MSYYAYTPIEDDPIIARKAKGLADASVQDAPVFAVVQVQQYGIGCDGRICVMVHKNPFLSNVLDRAACFAAGKMWAGSGQRVRARTLSS